MSNLVKNSDTTEVSHPDKFTNIQWQKLSFENIDGVVPEVRGQRAFPSKQLAHCDPFVLLDHIGPQKMPENFHVEGHLHPHRGFETITFMFEGNLHHQDNVGPRILLSSGGVQKMNAGRGISHGGDMWADEKSQHFHEIQLWVNSPAKQKMSVPEINNFKSEDIPIIEGQDLSLRIIAGNQQDNQGKVIQGPVNTFANIAIFHGISHNQLNEFQPVKVTIDVNPLHNKVVIYPLKGNLEVMLNGKKEALKEFETLIIEADGLNKIQLSHINGEFLFLSGQSLNEPVVMGGPFVMNSQEQIRQANNDYVNGYFD